MKVSEAISQLQRFHQPDDEIAMSTFDIEDVEDRCDERNITMTGEEMRRVLREMHRECSADHGLNWDVMDTAIDSVRVASTLR